MERKYSAFYSGRRWRLFLVWVWRSYRDYGSAATDYHIVHHEQAGALVER